MKNRYGISEQVIPTAFYGSVGWFKELPKSEEIQDHAVYFDQQKNIPNLSLIQPQKVEVKDEVRKEPKKEICYNF